MIQKPYIQEKVKEMEKERDRYNMSLVVSRGRAKAKEGKETNLPILLPPSRYKNQQSYPPPRVPYAVPVGQKGWNINTVSCPALTIWRRKNCGRHVNRGVSIFREEMQANPNSQLVL